MRDSRVVWLGNKDLILSSGFDMVRIHHSKYNTISTINIHVVNEQIEKNLTAVAFRFISGLVDLCRYSIKIINYYAQFY
jgi:hypothetical protein